MARKKKTEETAITVDLDAQALKFEAPYESVVAGLGNAVTFANEWHTRGYEILVCIAVVANDENQNPVQAIYMLAKRTNS